MKTGKIVRLSGIAGAGLWTLELEDACVFIESGAGGRALAQCFGSLENIHGHAINYETDDLNVLIGFDPIR
jgi:hypothetical protein